MNRRVFLWSLTSALAGFLFGFDTVVISGAEQTIQSLWNLSDGLHGLAMSAALWGTVLGAIIGGWPTDRFGRKTTLLGIGLFYFVSAVWSGLATDVYSFMVARFLGGLGVGISTVAAPLYIAEVAPPESRGKLAGMFQFNIVFGILVAFLSNSIIAQVGDQAWRWMLGVEAFPAIIYTALCLLIPESPRWLIGMRGETERGLSVLRLVYPQESAQKLADLAKTIATSTAEKSRISWEGLKGVRKPLFLAFMIAFFNQLSGINAILYFAPRIFAMTGLGAEAALLQSIGIGVTNLIFTLLGLWMIDRIGRRTLLYIGGIGYLVSLGACSWAFYSETFAIVPACIFLFIAAHAVGQGAVIWVFISEIFPNRFRAVGQSVGSFTHWIFAALLTAFFPKMVTLLSPELVFLFFFSMMVLQLIWLKVFVPETKGVPLESIAHQSATPSKSRITPIAKTGMAALTRD